MIISFYHGAGPGRPRSPPGTRAADRGAQPIVGGPVVLPALNPHLDIGPKGQTATSRYLRSGRPAVSCFGASLACDEVRDRSVAASPALGLLPVNNQV